MEAKEEKSKYQFCCGLCPKKESACVPNPSFPILTVLPAKPVLEQNVDPG
jgi:hypothetical protein